MSDGLWPARPTRRDLAVTAIGAIIREGSRFPSGTARISPATSRELAERIYSTLVSEGVIPATTQKRKDTPMPTNTIEGDLPIVKALLATEKRHVVTMLGHVYVDAPVNPDGPAAAALIRQLVEALEGARADIDYACEAIQKLNEHKARARLEQTLRHIDALLAAQQAGVTR